MSSSSLLPPSSCSSSCLLNVRRLVWPTAREILRQVMVVEQQRLRSDDDDNQQDDDTDLPLFSASSSSASTCRHAFRHQHGSAVHVLRQLQRDWALRLAVPGAYLFLDTTGVVPPVHRRRLASLLLHPEFAALVRSSNNHNSNNKSTVEDLRAWHRQAHVRRRVVRVARQVQWILYERCNSNNDNDDVPYLLFQGTNERYLTSNNDDEDDQRQLEPEDHRALLAPVARALMSTTRTTTSTTKNNLNDDDDDGDGEWRHALHELVILLEHCATASQVQRCLGEFLEKESSSHHHQLLEQLVGDGEPPQPRRDHVTALLEGALEDNNNNNNKDACSSEIHVPGYLYRILLDRAAIPENEWFQAFVETYRHHSSNNNSTCPAAAATTPQALFDLFGCGVRQLQIAGLIRPRRAGGKAGTLYEKTALVWCGGD